MQHCQRCGRALDSGSGSDSGSDSDSDEEIDIATDSVSVLSASEALMVETMLVATVSEVLVASGGDGGGGGVGGGGGGEGGGVVVGGGGGGDDARMVVAFDIASKVVLVERKEKCTSVTYLMACRIIAERSWFV
jgi:hypothetical protein